MKYLQQLFESINLQSKSNIIIHCSFKKFSRDFPETNPGGLINSLKKYLTGNGSIIIPTFTYCFKKSVGEYEFFDRTKSKSKVGLLSESFRMSDGVIRTSSPTHSFSLWGKITNEIKENNSPESPLGKGSVMEWIAENPGSYVLMLGTDFSSLTYGHYLEIEAKLPWYDFSPWDYMGVLPIGVSTDGEQKLKEIPGCAKSFVNFEKHLLKNRMIKKHYFNDFFVYLIPVKLLHHEGLNYFKENSEKLLCSENTCPACDSRRKQFL